LFEGDILWDVEGKIFVHNNILGVATVGRGTSLGFSIVFSAVRVLCPTVVGANPASLAVVLFSILAAIA
jgi:hypothetical protein